MLTGEYLFAYKILFWFVITSIGFSCTSILTKKFNLCYHTNPILYTIYYFTFTLLYFIPFNNELLTFFANYTSIGIIALLAVIVINTKLSDYIDENTKTNYPTCNYNYPSFMKRWNRKYIVSKSFDILFQQISLISIILYMQNLGFENLLIIGILFFVFGVGHVFKIFVNGKFYGEYFTAFGILASLVFPIVILFEPYGFYITYTLHWTFYTISKYYFLLAKPKTLMYK